MSSDVFIISAAQDANAPKAIQKAVELAGVHPAEVHDALFGLDGSSAFENVEALVLAAGLSCPSACVSSSLRAVFFAAASILGDDTQLSVVSALGSDPSTALVLASPESVGRMNLLPRARIAARSLVGVQPTLQAAGITDTDLEIIKRGEQAAYLLYDLLDELEAKPARWGMVQVGEALMIVERV